MVAAAFVFVMIVATLKGCQMFKERAPHAPVSRAIVTDWTGDDRPELPPDQAKPGFRVLVP